MKKQRLEPNVESRKYMMRCKQLISLLVLVLIHTGLAVSQNIQVAHKIQDRALSAGFTEFILADLSKHFTNNNGMGIRYSILPSEGDDVVTARIITNSNHLRIAPNGLETGTEYIIIQASAGSSTLTDTVAISVDAITFAATFPNAANTITTRDARHSYVADMDGDGDMDVVSATNSIFAWYENTGTSTWPETVIDTGSFTAGFAADVDGDGDMDALSLSSTGSTLAWYENTGAGTWPKNVISTTVNSPSDMHTADMDGDGDLDVIAVARFSGTVTWYENTSAGTWSRSEITTTADQSRGVFVADLDGDGDMDVLSASNGDDTVEWYENTGTSTWTNRVITTTASRVWAVHAADMDGDGDMDVLSASYIDDTIAWYENTGTGTWLKTVITNSADYAVGVQAADLDGDGDMDVLSASSNDDTIAWYENTGTGTWSKTVITATADGAFTVRAADMDGDGDLDVVATSAFNNTLMWFENVSGVEVPFALQTVSLSDDRSFSNGHIVNNTPSFKLRFNKTIDVASLVDGVSFFEQGKTNRIAPTIQSDGTRIGIVLPSVSLYTATSYELRLDATLIKDQSGNPLGSASENRVFTFSTSDLADLTLDGDIDAADLNELRTVFVEKNTNFNIGPITEGTLPKVKVENDNIIDIEDVLAFAQSWRFSKTQNSILASTYSSEGVHSGQAVPSVPELSRYKQVEVDNEKTSPIELAFPTNGRTYNNANEQESSSLFDEMYVLADLTDTTTTMEFVVKYDPSRMDVREIKQYSVFGENGDTFSLSHHDSLNGVIVLNAVNFGELNSFGASDTLAKIKYTLRNNRPVLISYGQDVFLSNDRRIKTFENVELAPQHDLPTEFVLEQNFPNPFNPSTTIRFQVPEAAQTQLMIFDVLGRQVATLVDNQLAPGYYQFNWDATTMSSGVYMYVLLTNTYSGTNISKVQKMTLIK